MLEALKELHERAHIVHRDIKPANIVIHNHEVKLIDFGMSSDKVNPQTPCGTPNYMAPEIFEFRPYTSKVDLWSLGVLLYYAAAGHVPFEEANVRVLRRRIEQHISGQVPLLFPDTLSSEAVDFISHLLTHERVRPDAIAALNHPWLRI